MRNGSLYVEHRHARRNGQRLLIIRLRKGSIVTKKSLKDMKLE